MITWVSVDAYNDNLSGISKSRRLDSSMRCHAGGEGEKGAERLAVGEHVDLYVLDTRMPQ
jgi:hypothetical protein